MPDALAQSLRALLQRTGASIAGAAGLPIWDTRKVWPRRHLWKMVVGGVYNSSYFEARRKFRQPEPANITRRFFDRMESLLAAQLRP